MTTREEAERIAKGLENWARNDLAASLGTTVLKPAVLDETLGFIAAAILREQAQTIEKLRKDANESNRILGDECERLTEERDQAVAFIRTMTEECVLYGMPGGDRNVLLANLRIALCMVAAKAKEGE